VRVGEIFTITLYILIYHYNNIFLKLEAGDMGYEILFGILSLPHESNHSIVKSNIYRTRYSYRRIVYCYRQDIRYIYVYCVIFGFCLYFITTD
jgi:hypothetical protein